jgi:BirA family transcriptional regulator, biotin operon repressor / biotin---[acetyl-CoA-carboxylase] ligase
LASILHFDSLESTNDEAFRQADAGKPDGLWIVADEQTKGRGRRQRAWLSEKGNLFCTRLTRLAPGDPPRQQLSFVAALALTEALGHWVDSARLQIKWPNDLLLDSLKCAGILLESSDTARQAVIAVGIGVNLAHHPQGTERPATSLGGSGLAPPPTREVLARLADQFDGWRQRWASGGFAPIRLAWLARAHGLGQRITVRLPDETLTGVFQDLDTDGALLLRLDSGRLHPVHAGEIFGI